MRHDLQCDLGGAVGISIAIASDPGCKFDGGRVDGEFSPEGDEALGVEFAEVGGDSIPEDGFDDSVAACCFLLDGGFDTSVEDMESWDGLRYNFNQ